MPAYPKVKTIEYYPNPELVIRKLHEGLEIKSILDAGAGHGGVFDFAYWSERPMERRAACDLFWLRDMPGWETKTGVDVTELSKHYPPKSVDYVQCMEVLEHVPRNAVALESLCDVATKLVVITSADETHHWGPEQERIEGINPHQKYLKQPSIKDLEDLGFEVRVEHLERRQIIAWKYLCNS